MFIPITYSSSDCLGTLLGSEYNLMNRSFTLLAIQRIVRVMMTAGSVGYPQPLHLLNLLASEVNMLSYPITSALLAPLLVSS